jgi:predicted DNA-binding ribbon-helix-helix protein
MEPEMWDALQEASTREALSLHDFCTAVAKRRGGYSMTAAIRVHLLNYFRAAATDAGHKAAGHGKLRSKR